MNTRVSAFESELVSADRDAFEPSRSRFGVDAVMQTLRNFATISEALRMLGAGVILASMSVFLLQGWSEGNDISRYFLLLMQTGLLGAAGFTLSHVVRETRGARLFFGLALVSIPANFTILGALLYSVFQWDGGLGTYPGYADWRIDDVANIGMTMGAAMLVLVPVALFCFAIMARRSAKSLSLHFLLLNALLLLPIRGSLAAGTVALLGAAYALYAIGGLTRRDPALKTGEGKFALAALFIAPGIILFRSVYFYQVDSLMIAMIGMVLFLVTRQASQFPGRNERLATALDFLSWPLAMTIAIALTDAFAFAIASGFKAPLLSAVYSLLAFDIVRRTAAGRLAKAIGASIIFVVAASFSFSVMLTEDGVSALFSIAAGALMFLWGAAGRKLVPIIAGLATLAIGVLFGFDAILKLIVTSSWVELAIFGAGAIVLGSVLDRHGATIKLRVTRWHERTRPDAETAESMIDQQPG